MKTLRFHRPILLTNSTSRSSRRGLKSSINGLSSASCSTDSIGSSELLQAWHQLTDRMERLIARRPRVAHLVVGELERLLNRLE